MSFSQDQGYIPATIAELMETVRLGVNEAFSTSYDSETFQGTNFYKYFYALIQRLQEHEIKTSEIVLKLQQYFALTNEKITRPNTTHPGILDYLTALGYVASTKKPIDADAGKLYVAVDETDNYARGSFVITSYANLLTGAADTVTVGSTVFTAQAGAATLGTGTFQAATSNAATATSLSAQINGHATAAALVTARVLSDGVTVEIRAKAAGTGGNAIALAYTNNDANVGATKSGTTLTGGRALAAGEADYPARRLEICTAIKTCAVAGVVSQGEEIETITLSNNQSFDFKFNLPSRHPILLRLTITESVNNAGAILSDQAVTDLLYANIQARYRLGLDFEPQRYFSVLDAPWASHVLLEYSLNAGGAWLSTVYTANYNDLLTFAESDITVINA